MEEEILITNDRKRGCSWCGKGIFKGDKYITRTKSAWKGSVTINCCAMCIVKAQSGINKKDLSIIKDRLLLNELEEKEK
jgi:hypothetical protein